MSLIGKKEGKCKNLNSQTLKHNLIERERERAKWGRGGRRKQEDLSYPVVAAVVGTEGFVASFQDRLTLLSPINEGVFECNGWI
jgi:hypothetical protein